MFKLMLLGQWHNLSDTQLEHALTVRVDFMAFTGFEPDEQGFPDATTICRFRNRLVSAKLDTKLLHLINTQLQTQGLKVKQSEGAILDATIITSAARPRQWLETNELSEADPSQDEANKQEVQVRYSADPDASWVKKGNKSYFGYRGYAVVDVEDGYVDHVMMRPANESETQQLQEVVNQSPSQPKALLTDKGFASKANRQFLESLGVLDLIQHKKVKGQQLHPIYKELNKTIARMRYKVEQGFGTMKRQFGLSRARYMTTVRVQAQMCWAALGMNLLKAHNKLKQMQQVHGVGAPNMSR